MPQSIELLMYSQCTFNRCMCSEPTSSQPMFSLHTVTTAESVSVLAEALVVEVTTAEGLFIAGDNMVDSDALIITTTITNKS